MVLRGPSKFFESIISSLAIKMRSTHKWGEVGEEGSLQLLPRSYMMVSPVAQSATVAVRAPWVRGPIDI